MEAIVTVLCFFLFLAWWKISDLQGQISELKLPTPPPPPWHERLEGDEWKDGPVEEDDDYQ